MRLDQRLHTVLHPLFAVILVAAAAGLSLAAPEPARADGLTEITGFGSSPGNLRMFRYAPADMAANVPVVVALHGCTQSATAYDDEPGWTALAERWKFLLVLPQQQSANNFNGCFNWFSTGDITRGQREALSVKQMVDRTTSDYPVDAGRIFVTGLSAGGAFAAVMLATYPEVFAGGAILSGLPYRCATTVSAAFGCMSPLLELHIGHFWGLDPGG